MSTGAGDAPLPAGVRRHELTRHLDARGSLVEVFRESFDAGVRPVQWNASSTQAGVLRGVRAHATHLDWLIVLAGTALAGLRDLRPDAPPDGAGTVVELRGDSPVALLIPPGVAHGFYFPEPSLHVIGVSHCFDASDEMACHWADPDLGIPWPDIRPTLSERDASAGSLADMRRALARRWRG